MWEILGLCRTTLKMVQVAIAANAQEKEYILDEERDRYHYFVVHKLRMAAVA